MTTNADDRTALTAESQPAIPVPEPGRETVPGNPPPDTDPQRKPDHAPDQDPVTPPEPVADPSPEDPSVGG